MKKLVIGQSKMVNQSTNHIFHVETESKITFVNKRRNSEPLANNIYGLFVRTRIGSDNNKPVYDCTVQLKDAKDKVIILDASKLVGDVVYNLQQAIEDLKSNKKMVV